MVCVALIIHHHSLEQSLTVLNWARAKYLVVMNTTSYIALMPSNTDTSFKAGEETVFILMS